ncbi:MAG: 2-C-methyl-D-erythritol 2,4-cyclodiphosphate synthase [Methylohalobius sp.]|nr:2-C-methyl-D-erythritol 2,4-cyclodiphosphate synthase [Methylohalobius sp.]
MNFRVGCGYDAHRFGQGDHLVLGGVKIPFTKGICAHSDGDVALHALCDALLGAAGLGDIGRHFPDSDPSFKGIDSRVLVRRVQALLAEKNLEPINVDLTIVCQAPRLAPYIPRMQENIATDLGIHPSQVNVKATTTEGMGFEGRGEGISAQAVALVRMNI